MREKCAHDHVRSFTHIAAIPGNQSFSPNCAVIDPLTVPNWNADLPENISKSVFHSAEWARVLLETYRWRPFYLRHAQSILPIIEARSWATARRGVCLPFTDFCEPLAQDAASGPKLLAAALELGRERNWKYLEVRGGGESLGENVTASAQFYGHELDLRKSEDQLFGSFDSSVRRAIRKAQKVGVTVSLETDPTGLRDFWSLHVQTRRKHGVPPQPFSFMKRIQEQLIAKGMGLISVARHQGKPIAACVFLHFGSRVLFKFGASHPAHQELRGMNAAFWTAIRHYAARGFSGLHFGRTDMDNDGLRRFKLGWGATETVLSYCRYDFSRSSFVQTARTKPNKMVNHLFRALPAPALRLIGTLLYKHAA